LRLLLVQALTLTLPLTITLMLTITLKVKFDACNVWSINCTQQDNMHRNCLVLCKNYNIGQIDNLSDSQKPKTAFSTLPNINSTAMIQNSTTVMHYSLVFVFRAVDGSYWLN